MPADTSAQDLFAVETPLGFTVRVSARYWSTIVAKHPDLADHLAEVQAALREPEEIDRAVGTPEYSCSTAPPSDVDDGSWRWRNAKMEKASW